MTKHIAILLHGSGVYDGTEIHEAVLSMIALAEKGHTYECFAPDKEQTEVINHLSGEPIRDKRNVLEESARIARGNIKPLIQMDLKDFDGLLIPGGFGAAKNLTNWAQKNAACTIDPLIQETIASFVLKRKPIVALCMSVTTVAKALEGTPYALTLSVGNFTDNSLYDIAAIHKQMELTGHHTSETTEDIFVDKTNRVISAPCYMMDIDILTLKRNIYRAIDTLETLF